MIDETLYPHEQVLRFLDNNALKFAATLFFVTSGIGLVFGIANSHPLTIGMGVLSYIFGWIVYEIDINCRGL
ncbi:MAG: hypothetical protein WCX79_01235 [Candidatus Paceibacterota bacterium]|jgi:hypothetical protein